MDRLGTSPRVLSVSTAVEATRPHLERDPAQLRMHLILAAGNLAASGLPASAASCLLAVERLFPDDRDLSSIVWWRADGSTPS